MSLGRAWRPEGMRAAAQTPADKDTSPQNPTGQSAVMQKRPAAPLTQDSDPVPWPDAAKSDTGQTQMPGSGQRSAGDESPRRMGAIRCAPMRMRCG